MSNLLNIFKTLNDQRRKDTENNQDFWSNMMSQNRKAKTGSSTPTNLTSYASAFGSGLDQGKELYDEVYQEKKEDSLRNSLMLLQNLSNPPQNPQTQYLQNNIPLLEQLKNSMLKNPNMDLKDTFQQFFNGYNQETGENVTVEDINPNSGLVHLSSGEQHDTLDLNNIFPDYQQRRMGNNVRQSMEDALLQQAIQQAQLEDQMKMQSLKMQQQLQSQQYIKNQNDILLKQQQLYNNSPQQIQSKELIKTKYENQEKAKEDLNIAQNLENSLEGLKKIRKTLSVIPENSVLFGTTSSSKWTQGWYKNVLRNFNNKTGKLLQTAIESAKPLEKTFLEIGRSTFGARITDADLKILLDQIPNVTGDSTGFKNSCKIWEDKIESMKKHAQKKLEENSY